MLLIVLTGLEVWSFLPVAVCPQYKRVASIEVGHREGSEMSECRAPEKGQLRDGSQFSSKHLLRIHEVLGLSPALY